VAAYLVVGLAGAATTVGAILGFKALGEKRDFDNGDKTAERVEAIEKNAVMADMAFGAAIALGITGAVLWLTANEGGSDLTASVQRPSVVALVPLVSLAGGGASALFRF
jgi:hypothetical protein